MARVAVVQSAETRKRDDHVGKDEASTATMFRAWFLRKVTQV